MVRERQSKPPEKTLCRRARGPKSALGGVAVRSKVGRARRARRLEGLKPQDCASSTSHRGALGESALPKRELGNTPVRRLKSLENPSTVRASSRRLLLFERSVRRKPLQKRELARQPPSRRPKAPQLACSGPPRALPLCTRGVQGVYKGCTRDAQGVYMRIPLVHRLYIPCASLVHPLCTA
jgi:hypothetical protein